MKTRIMIALLASLLSSGCSTVGKLVDEIPEGSATRIHYTRTGKFSTTSATVEGWSKTENEVKAERLEIRHSNAWMPNVAIELEDYVRSRGDGK
jgi:uncharacterized protein YceK